MKTITSHTLPHHIKELLCVLLNEVTNYEAVSTCTLINADDFGSNWQAKKILEAIESAAKEGQPDDALTISEVGSQLLEAGELTNDSLKSYWLNLAFPDVPYHPIGKQRISRLIARIVEDHFRTRHGEIYGRDDSHDKPLEELTAQMSNDREELLSIFARIRPVSLSIVKEQSA